jgi:flavin reductase (DIM6/NTAB) family NADH-FMN oxidoreductase RutF
MKDRFREVEAEFLTENVFKRIGKDWMLITAGVLNHFNTMTASWGGWGVLWERKVCFCVIRPQRYTRQFMEQAQAFSLTFFAEKYRQVLEFCGSRSGRDVDKVVTSGLTPIETSPGIISFAEGMLIMECKKIYFQDLDPAHFIDPTIAEFYPAHDYHRMYIGELIRCLVRPQVG